MCERNVFHVTPAIFDRFDMSYCGSIKGNAGNSSLGLFFSCSEVNNDFPAMARHMNTRFPHIIKARLDISASIILTIRGFRNITAFKTPVENRMTRQAFLDKGIKTLLLQETAGLRDCFINDETGEKDSISTIIVLDESVIVSAEYIMKDYEMLSEPQPLLSHTHSLSLKM